MAFLIKVCSQSKYSRNIKFFVRMKLSFHPESVLDKILSLPNTRAAFNELKIFMHNTELKNEVLV